MKNWIISLIASESIFFVLALQFERFFISMWGIHFFNRSCHERVFHWRRDRGFYRLSISNLDYFPIVVCLNLELWIWFALSYLPYSIFVTFFVACLCNHNAFIKNILVLFVVLDFQEVLVLSFSGEPVKF